MSLAELDTLLKASTAKATPFAKTVFEPGNEWPATRVQEFINAVGSAAAATTSEAGWPHAGWVPVSCLDGSIFLAGTPGSVFLRNAEVTGRLAIVISGHGHAVIGQGTCRVVTANEALRAAFAHLGGADLADDERPWLRGLVLFTPKRLFAS